MPQSSAGQLATLDAGGLQRFEALRREAVEAVTERFYATHGADYEQFGDRGRQAFRRTTSGRSRSICPLRRLDAESQGRNRNGIGEPIASNKQGPCPRLTCVPPTLDARPAGR